MDFTVLDQETNKDEDSDEEDGFFTGGLTKNMFIEIFMLDSDH